MTTETEELLWIGSQEYKLIPRDIVLFGLKNKKTMFELLTADVSFFNGVNNKTLEKFLQNRENIPFEQYHKIYDQMKKDHVNLITCCDPLFPSYLKESDQQGHPILLYHQGEKMKFDNCVAVVGTRNCSTQAVEFARELGRGLSEIGYVIVAGLARGIDAAAHRGAISIGGMTIAVLPWFHQPYPPEHERLLEEIKKNGCVISENFFQSKFTDKYKFIERNSIISGISNVVIAVESSFSGGTRWQVEIALAQGKQVIAMEPEKDNELAYDGFRKFLQKGAKKASTIPEAIEIIKREAKIKESSLDEFNSDVEIELKTLQKT